MQRNIKLPILLATCMFAAEDNLLAQANQSLSNLTTPTAVNQHILPGTNNTTDLGASATGWRDIYFNGIFYKGSSKALHFYLSNTATGMGALNVSTGNYNTATGYNSLNANTTGTSNTANGYRSLYSNTTGGSNTASGYYAMTNNSTGSLNVASGKSALYSNTTGRSNVAIGASALYKNTNRNNLVAVGDSALFNNGLSASIDYHATENTAIGSKALYANTTGYKNTATGFSALKSNTTGSGNVATGQDALSVNTTGAGNVAIGTAALKNNTAGKSQVAVGDSALYSQTLNGQGLYNNAAVGSKALFYNTTGYSNAAFGNQALYKNTTGSQNTATGYRALSGNTTGIFNTANGYMALPNNDGGYGNTAVGHSTLYSSITGSNNTAVGYAALYTNSRGYNNVAIGFQPMYKNETGYDNIAIGTAAMYSSDYSFQNVSIGANSMYSNDNGDENVAIGYDALNVNTTGNWNIAIGTTSFVENTTGIGNTVVGGYAGANDDGYYYSTAVGFGANFTADYQARIGGNATQSIGGYQDWTNVSDGRIKKNIKANVPGLAFINKLRPVTYNLDLDAAENITAQPASNAKEKEALKKEPAKSKEARLLKEQALQTGFIAQEVEKAAKELNFEFSGVDAAKNDKDLYGLRYAQFVVPLVKAVQELSAKNEDLQNQLNELKQMVLSGNKTTPPITGDDKVQVQSASLSDISLEQNIPNPFAHTTTINYTLPATYTAARMIITDKNGKTIKDINIAGAGKGSLKLDAALLSNGSYQYSLVVDGRIVATKQMMLMR